MNKFIQDALAGKRFAVMGFEQEEASSIISTLADAHSVGHVVGDQPTIPGLNSFTAFDACLVEASAAGTGELPAPIELIGRSRKPALVIGNSDALMPQFDVVGGVNRDFLLRPWQPEELLLRTYRIIKFAELASEAIQRSSRNGVRMVVLADDDATTVVLLTTLLKHFNFKCEIAYDGAQALIIASEKRPDLVLLDVSMPKMNGFEALAKLRGSPVTRTTPVILISSHRDEAEVVKGFSLGADDYVTKPFNSGELIARIGRVLAQ